MSLYFLKTALRGTTFPLKRERLSNGNEKRGSEKFVYFFVRLSFPHEKKNQWAVWNLYILKIVQYHDWRFREFRRRFITPWNEIRLAYHLVGTRNTVPFGSFCFTYNLFSSREERKVHLRNEREKKGHRKATHYKNTQNVGSKHNRAIFT